MATNLTLFPVDGPVTLYWQDGSSEKVEAQQTCQRQMIDGGICTISDSPDDIDAHEFAEAMVRFWQGLVDKIRAEAAGQAPTATPL